MIKVFNVSKDNIPSISGNVSCIGFFDGVHLGHQALIRKTVEEAKKLNVDANLITFWPDPSEFIPGKRVEHINTLERRIELFEKFGINNVIIIEFDKDVMSLDEKVFSETYLKKLNLKGLVCGFDFHYGYKGKGSYLTLKKEFEDLFEVYMVEEVKYDDIKVSSSRIREELNKGNIDLVNTLLGYKY